MVLLKSSYINLIYCKEQQNKKNLKVFLLIINKKRLKMGLFGFGKNKEKKNEGSNSVPLPSEKSSIPEIGEIKKAVSKPRREFWQMQPIQQKNDEDINENPFKEFKLLQPLPVRPRMQEMRDINYEKNMEEEYAKPAEKPRIKIRDISEPLEAPIREKAKGPIYVKIEKFESALSDFEDIRKRLHESFELLEKVKSIRGREEEELEAWEREVDNIKRKLLEIDRNLFNRADY